ncbi:glycoside hydrolase domain-containing protein [Curtobacterium sp. VKM Ac-1393]|uniref:glycoside hydrolase domain-containing protein n=1 Tax=Curtobacterium sp. VKM Ac-1393 TaxID=2783814 RepID=UPI00188B80F7|nr:glycoside hydrolase domain-containing protein [Curtobacterium sp. VKM Ac-1393]MBF4608447.1 DUF1906 domain-containing protein [Curtobacterium sp. VKM Ac-1393]
MQISRRAAVLGIAAIGPLLATTLAAPAEAGTPTATDPSGQPGPDAATGVLGVQRWLNTTFGHLDGWVHVDEDGVTGAGTVNGVVQAVQSLLGITPVVPAVGAATRQGLHRHGAVGAEHGADAATWCRLAQAGLLCKGFDAVALTGKWDDQTLRAVQALRTGLGAAPAGPTLSPQLFGALLTVDPIALAAGGDPAVRAVQQSLNRTYAETDAGAYGSTSGLVDASTGRAAVRAVQIASGAATVDGSWGPASAGALRAAQASVVGQGATGPWVELVTGLLVLNRRRVVLDAVFSAADAAAVRAFQQFQAFPRSERTGVCDFGTWAALIASCGDADRPTTGADTAKRLDAARAAAVRDAGVTIVGRYLTNHQTPGALDKALTRSELDTMRSAGIGLWPIFEEGGFAASWFTRQQGIADAHRAHDAARRLGLPKQTTIYFAADFDATADQAASLLIPYFRGVAQGLADRGDEYKAGVYGSRLVCATVSHAGLAHCSYVAGMSTGWTGNTLQPLPDNWAFDQIQGRTAGTGDGTVEIDAVVVSGRDPGVTLTA